MKFKVTARAFDRETGKPKGRTRTETVDTAKNFLFKGMTNIMSIHSAYEAFWNNLNVVSPEVVFVSRVTPLPTSRI